MSPNCHSEEPFEQPIGRDIQSVLDRLREAARTAPETDPSYTPQNYNDPEWQRGWLARKRFEAAGIPALFAEKSIDDYKPLAHRRANHPHLAALHRRSFEDRWL